MPDWIERMDASQVKLVKELPSMRLKWESTTAPETPILLPIGVNVTVSAEGIHIHAERIEGESFLPAEEAHLQFSKQEIISVEIILMPEVEDAQWTQVSDYSRAIIRHRDPYDVVECFESVFISYKDYWLRALAKGLKERLGVKYTFTEAKRA